MKPLRRNSAKIADQNQTTCSTDRLLKCKIVRTAGLPIMIDIGNGYISPCLWGDQSAVSPRWTLWEGSDQHVKGTNLIMHLSKLGIPSDPRSGLGRVVIWMLQCFAQVLCQLSQIWHAAEHCASVSTIVISKVMSTHHPAVLVAKQSKHSFYADLPVRSTECVARQK